MLAVPVSWLIPFGIVLLGIVTGWTIEQVIPARLRRLAKKTKWEGDEIFIHAMRGMLVVWCAIAGVYTALLFVDLGEHETAVRDILLASLYVSGTIVAARTAGGFVELWSRGEGTTTLPATSLFGNMVRGTVIAVGLLMALQELGVSVTPLLTAFGIGGLAVALALQGTLSNLFAGMRIMVSKQLKPGDYIKLQSGEEGHIDDINWSSTTIRQLSNTIVVAPNAKLVDAIVTKYHQTENEVLAEARVAYGNDLGLVERIARDVAREAMQAVGGNAAEFEPLIQFHTFGDLGMHFTVKLRARELAERPLVKHEFLKRLHERFVQEGIISQASAQRHDA